MWGGLLDASHGEKCGLDVDTLEVTQVKQQKNKYMVRNTHGGVSKLELEGGMNGIGGEGLEGFFGHTNDHGTLR